MNDQCDRRSFVKIGAAAGAAWVMGRNASPRMLPM